MFKVYSVKKPKTGTSHLKGSNNHANLYYAYDVTLLKPTVTGSISEESWTTGKSLVVHNILTVRILNVKYVYIYAHYKVNDYGGDELEGGGIILRY